MIRMTSQRVADEWQLAKLDPNLRRIVNQSASYLYRVWNQDLDLSCLMRTPDEDKALYHDPQHEPGVHCYGRGADISIRHLSLSEVRGLVHSINETWLYDPKRPTMLCALYEDATHPDSSAPHIHLQSHPDTQFVTRSDVPKLTDTEPAIT